MTEVFVSSSEPQQSNIIKFRVSINFPADWKLRSIAEYKRAQKRKHQQLSSDSNNGDCDSSSIYKSPRQDPIAAPTRTLPDRSRSYLESKGVLTVEQRAEIISNMRRNKPKDQIENELQMWEEKCIHIKKQIYNLNLKRNQLMWLLNKSSLTERASICS